MFPWSRKSRSGPTTPPISSDDPNRILTAPERRELRERFPPTPLPGTPIPLHYPSHETRIPEDIQIPYHRRHFLPGIHQDRKDDIHDGLRQCNFPIFPDEDRSYFSLPNKHGYYVPGLDPCARKKLDTPRSLEYMDSNSPGFMDSPGLRYAAAHKEVNEAAFKEDKILYGLGGFELRSVPEREIVGHGGKTQMLFWNVMFYVEWALGSLVLVIAFKFLLPIVLGLVIGGGLVVVGLQAGERLDLWRQVDWVSGLLFYFGLEDDREE